MIAKDPVGELDPQFSGDDATPTAWSEGRELLERAELYWLSTVRPDGRPHVTPLISVWLDDRLYFCTGDSERKAKNLAGNPYCVITTGCNGIQAGLDLVIEGEARPIHDDTMLQKVADTYESKYGKAWRFTVRDGIFNGDDGNAAVVYELIPATAFGFGKGKSFSQTRWRF